MKTPFSFVQRGFSLIELMVAIAIAMIVTAGAVAVFSSMRSTFTSQDRLGQLQDSQRLAITMLTTTIQSAGFFIDPKTNTADGTWTATTVANNDGSKFAATAVIVGTVGTGTNSSDSINVRYQSLKGDGLMNCKGDTVPSTAAAGTVVTWINSFEINASNQLQCRIGTGTAEPLIDNVYSMNVSYLVSLSTGYAYMNATDVGTSGNWSNVLAARIKLQFLDTVKSTASTPVALPNPVYQTINLMNRS